MDDLHKPQLDSMFQFHKVRLKDITIKNKREIDKFQFHKVRLKDNQPGYTGKNQAFQFHKVRLKVECC